MINVAFADLDETPKLGETREAHGDRFAGECVQDNVDAPPPGQFHDSFHKVAAPRIDNVFHAERHQKRALNRTAGARYDFGAQMMGDLNCRHAHATCTGVNENPLALAQSGDIFQGMP